MPQRELVVLVFAFQLYISFDKVWTFSAKYHLTNIDWSDIWWLCNTVLYPVQCCACIALYSIVYLCFPFLPSFRITRQERCTHGGGVHMDADAVITVAVFAISSACSPFCSSVNILLCVLLREEFPLSHYTVHMKWCYFIIPTPGAFIVLWAQSMYAYTQVLWFCSSSSPLFSTFRK